MTWFLLAFGIALEVAGTICMKLAGGFHRPSAAALMYVFYVLSLTTLTFAFRHIEIAFGYAVWSGAGLILIATTGILWFDEPATFTRLLCISLVLIGLIGLHLTSGAAR